MTRDEATRWLAATGGLPTVQRVDVPVVYVRWDEELVPLDTLYAAYEQLFDSYAGHATAVVLPDDVVTQQLYRTGVITPVAPGSWTLTDPALYRAQLHHVTQAVEALQLPGYQ